MTTAANDLDVTHDAAASRYVLQRGGEAIGTLSYRQVGRPGRDTVDVYSTNIRPASRGQGMGEALVRAALDDLRGRGSAVKASCWFVADFLDANPDYQDMRDGHDRPAAGQANPDTRVTPDVAHDAHERGMSDTDPVGSGGDPGRPRP